MNVQSRKLMRQLMALLASDAPTMDELMAEYAQRACPPAQGTVAP